MRESSEKRIHPSFLLELLQGMATAALETQLTNYVKDVVPDIDTDLLQYVVGKDRQKFDVVIYA